VIAHTKSLQFAQHCYLFGFQNQWAVVKWLEEEKQGFTTDLEQACKFMTEEFAKRRRNLDINDHQALSERALQMVEQRLGSLS
jgi:hypothetical protein